MSKFIALKNLVCLVTGGASGLGRATAEMFAFNGAHTIIGDISKSKGIETASQISAMTRKSIETDDKKDRCTSVHFDVTSESEVQGALDEIASKYGRLDVLVNCAGIGIAVKTYNSNKDRLHKLEDFARVLTVNTVGTFNVSRISAKLMFRNQPNADGLRGLIVHTASIAAYEGQIGQVAYAASKGAIVSMTLPMARDLATDGIRVMAVAPGIFNTPLLGALPDNVRVRLGKLSPLPSRLGEPPEFAHVVRMIVENPMLNGSVIRVDGALRMPP